MTSRQWLLGQLKRSKTGARLVNDPAYRVAALAVLSLTLHLAYAFYNGILGIRSRSVLFGASCAYYLLLSAMRFSVVAQTGRRGIARQRRSGHRPGVRHHSHDHHRHLYLL